MRKKTKLLISIVGLALGSFLAASSFMLSHAQKNTETQKVNNQNQDEKLRQARAEVAKSAVGSLLLETLLIEEPAWSLDRAGFIKKEPHRSIGYVGISLKKGDRLSGVDILECDSPKEADEQFGDLTTRSSGVSVPFNQYGDKGDKLIDQYGGLIAIRFRKSNFFVSIWNRDQKTAERFAKYVLHSLEKSKGIQSSQLQN